MVPERCFHSEKIVCFRVPVINCWQYCPLGIGSVVVHFYVEEEGPSVIICNCLLDAVSYETMNHRSLSSPLLFLYTMIGLVVCHRSVDAL